MSRVLQPHLSANFWTARYYATDEGGEVVRQAIDEAEQCERICTTPLERAALRALFDGALRGHRPHLPTQAAIDVLDNEMFLKQFGTEVKAAKVALVDVTASRHPIV
jgi:hypothetical protein